MKFRTLVPIILLPLVIHAQDPVSRNGPKIGLSMASQTSGGFLAWSGLPKFGPLGGWSFEVPLTYQISALIEPMYMSKGSYYMNGALKTSQSISLSYLEIPLMLKISTNPDPQGLFLTGGFMYGYFIKGRVRSYYDGNLTSDYSFASPNGNSQFSVGLGVGSEKKNWMWEIRGQNSITPFDILVRSHNIVFSAQLCWRFPLERKKKKHGDEDDDGK